MPQPGNPKKRIFRLAEDKSLINRLGFNNKGVLEVVDNLKKERDMIIGANIGKNYFTQNDDAHNDYLKCLSELNEFVDYFAINISSPNTKGLRDLHDKSLLKPFLEKLVKFNNKQMNKRPLLLKISPDLNEEQIADIVVLIKDLKLDGIIATNTTVFRDGATSKHKTQEGGMSGKLLTQKSNSIIKHLRKSLGDNFPIIGVGGIMSANDAIERLNSGADLIQLYTGFIYKGPSLIKEINKAIINQSN
jgi:dihydroorotate dehydrogenase